jgi:hypothetical protein
MKGENKLSCGEKDVVCVYVYEEWLPSALCGAARGCICDMYTQTHLEEEGGQK